MAKHQSAEIEVHFFVYIDSVCLTKQQHQVIVSLLLDFHFLFFFIERFIHFDFCFVLFPCFL